MDRVLKFSLPLILLIVVSCTSVPEHIPENLSTAQYFQKAQEAVARRNDYDTALLYYRTFKERFPEERGLQIEADYAIAFIYYRQGKLDTAERKFRDIVAAYESGELRGYYDWPLILSNRLLEIITEKRQGS